ncbi:MAG: cyclohexanone monooxygenase [Dehalococcoidia bacterium]|jgi:cation diffusion facilitator CzcD-associated flavoprotein CzcO|nr:MAG: NAD(P)/FAD-dependent oxidoreductase [SAR202 cluster bacterium]MCH2672573.1 NAD(P)/FAD-dependent oxidoreductase [Dehalococcoidia bacterium]GIS93179.1 MAG: cyclohexanone monooxygenase [Dehalococcoidia bacterium]|tara:strand:- start:22556 stop:24190 length:1635 start_codon:yes stop_codon:yes gene_type:complete
MADSLKETTVPTSGGHGEIKEFDAIIIGSGVTGLYSLYRMRQLGFSVRAFDDASGVGGTWYWNRYPGCRFDSESYSYGYSFSEELLQEWDWKEHYSAQPETERYLNYVADKFDLRRDIQFNSRVVSATYNEVGSFWEICLADGSRSHGRFLITSVGSFSAGYVPDFEGIDSFRGTSCHTRAWPKEGVDLAGKRVGVIGTGATGVQLITEIAKEVAHLTVFQRTANYCAPLRNGLIDAETQKQIKASYPEIFRVCMETPGSFMHEPDKRSAMDVSQEERLEQYERLWTEPGFKKWLSNFYDVMVPGKANEDYAEFVRNKIRERVHDPVVAEMLVPKDHMFGSKRLPCESGYYEVYNQDNVLLVDVREAPIERITPNGIKTRDEEYELDVIIYATGFDAITGGLINLNITGQNGVRLKDKFADGPRTYMGITSAGFPNLFTVNAASVGNFVRAAESLIDWVGETMSYLRDNDFKRIAPTVEAEDAWVKHVNEDGANILRTQANSWFVGANIPGKARALLTSPDTAPAMRAKRAEVAANGYEGFILE